MTTSRTLEALAKACYRHGVDPLHVAEAIVVVLIEDTLDVAEHTR